MTATYVKQLNKKPLHAPPAAHKAKQEGFPLARPLLVVIMAFALLVLPGTDIYTHTHEAWLYNYMIKNKIVLEKDFSMLDRGEALYGYGAPSYVLSGFAWFIFNKFTIKALEIIFFIGIILLSLKLFKNKNMLYLWFALVFYKIMQPDSYPYVASFFLFYLGIYLIKKFRKKWYGDVAITLAGLNHPYVALTNLSTAAFGRLPLFIASVAVVFVHFFLIKFIFFAGLVDFDLGSLFHLAERSVVLLLPFLAEFVPAKALKFLNIKTAYALLAFSLLIYFHPIIHSPYLSGFEEMGCYYRQNYNELQSLNLEGNLRIVDPCRSWTYIFPIRGLVTSQSSAFQGQYFNEKWNEAKYFTYLTRSNTTYVIFCKNCKVITATLQDTGELRLLQENFPLYANLDDFYVFDVRSVPAVVSKVKKHHGIVNSTIGIVKQLLNITAQKPKQSPQHSQNI